MRGEGERRGEGEKVAVVARVVEQRERTLPALEERLSEAVGVPHLGVARLITSPAAAPAAAGASASPAATSSLVGDYGRHPQALPSRLRQHLGP